jgi:Cft2 family RNA processing exonuclease
LTEQLDVSLKFFSEKNYLELATLLIEFDGKRILIDPGLNQRCYPIDKMLSNFNIPTLDAIVITHYHGDHANLTKRILGRNEFKGQILCHKATADVLYPYFDIKRQPDQFEKLGYDQTYQLSDNIGVTLFNAGHVLGSSILYFALGEKVLIISGDLGTKFLPIVPKPCSDFGSKPIDLLILDGKQAGKERHYKEDEYCFGDVLYYKLNDCFMLDDGNVIIYSPVLQIPILLYCLNYIFNKQKYIKWCRKIENVYLDANQTLRELLSIFHHYRDLFDQDEVENMPKDSHLFDFSKLQMSLPRETDIRRSIIITANRNKFANLFKQFRSSEKNDVLLLNNNIHYALDKNLDLIDRNCNIQIKRIPSLHYHPDTRELIDWCQEIRKLAEIKNIVLYHYQNRSLLEQELPKFKETLGEKIELVHQLEHDSITI